jgi:hypothetical protein
MEAKSCMSDVTGIPSRSRNHAQRSSQSEWKVRVGRCRYRGGTADLTPSNQTEVSHHKPFTKHCQGFHLIQKQSRSLDCFQQRRTSARLSGYRVSICQVFELQDGEKT